MSKFRYIKIFSLKSKMRFFLTSRHWVLFITMVGIPAIIYLAGMTFSILTDNMTGILYTFPFVMIFSGLMFLGWLWSIGIGLYPKIPEAIFVNKRRFRHLFIFVSLYMLALIISYNLLFVFNANPPLDFFYSTGLLVFIPIHLFYVFCLFYLLYYNAKTIRSIELNKEAKWSDFTGEFILLWFWPVGIWILQPRINRIATTL
ncbi:hypothetical protein [Fulvivirga sedimenti]|uniref:Uncharacterized protein n=1 Tax=Fulvivirga sedimenti TaxID=2879465 RepID=A0A9X1HQZ7_9BACT|nr:hypothetical protein [Fulvivirga sedimenti]MCA6075625.1 hypothetical protein [Fulvivirga sedimenti]